MIDLSDRIKMRLQHLCKSARRASIDGGLSPDAIRNVLRAKSRNPRRDTLEGIARGLDWSLEALLELPSAGTAPQSDIPVLRVPILGWVQGGSLTETTTPEIMENVDGYINVANSRETLIALRVTGSSMNRIAPDGSVIIVDIADKSLVAGRYYVLKYDDQVTFRRYRAGPYRLEPDSTEPHDSLFPDHAVGVVGHVTQVINHLP